MHITALRKITHLSILRLFFPESSKIPVFYHPRVAYHLAMYKKLFKRLIDLVLSIALLIIAAPAMLAVALLIRLQMGSPVLFRQARPGLGTKTFTLCKFRSMRHALDKAGQPLPDSDRLTRLGMFLRKFSLDELPQLLNVVRGDMSLVGPRPLLIEYLPLYSPRQGRRHEVRPGITGWAQVNGRNAISWEEKFEYDVWYIENLSFWLDMKILGLTAMKVLRREGVSQATHATMERFTGSK